MDNRFVVTFAGRHHGLGSWGALDGHVLVSFDSQSQSHLRPIYLFFLCVFIMTLRRTVLPERPGEGIRKRAARSVSQQAQKKIVQHAHRKKVVIAYRSRAWLLQHPPALRGAIH